MSNQSRSKTRLSRALGVALTPKAAKYMEKRPYAPGEHGRTKRKQDSAFARISVSAPSTASARSSSASRSTRPAAPTA